MGARDPVITGLGIVAAPGCGLDKNWGAILGGVCGLKPMSLFPSPRYGPVLTGQAPEDLTALGAPRRGSRTDRLGWLAAREALSFSGIDLRKNADRSGVVIGSSVGGSFDSEDFLTTLIKQGKMRPKATRYHECVSVVDLIASEFGLFGPSLAMATACSSGALAIATAAEFIQAGEADLMLAGGTDSLSRMTWGGFHSLLLVDAAGCRPFDNSRAGMSLGEGAAMLTLEAEETAQRRGATILARLTGWGASCDAHHATAPHPEGAGALAAMQGALRRAQLEARSIDYVNAHGTGTRENDLVEAVAIKNLFGENVPPWSSTKRFFGHALAASGAIEAVVCVAALRHQILPSNPGFKEIDPAIGLKPVVSPQAASLTHVMSNSFGFGGNNAVLIFSKPDAASRTRQAKRTATAVTSLGVIGPGAVAAWQIEEPLPGGSVLTRSCGPLTDSASLNMTQRRRLSRMIQMALLAARRAHAPEPARRLMVGIGTGFGCLEEGAMFIENMISKDERERMPTRFPGSVHNAPAAQIAIDLGARGLNAAPTAAEISFESALWIGMTQLAADEADLALVGAVDELNKYPLSIGQRWGFWSEQTMPGEGAVVASLARSEKGLTRLATVTTVRLGRQRRPFEAQREADWIAESVDLGTVDTVLTGAGGWPKLDAKYEAVIAALSRRAGRTLEHQTYKQLCGEYHSASAFGFSVAVELARASRRGVLLYTLSPRGGKALCCVQP